MRKYPRGKLNADDEGELAIKIANKDGTVVLDFGKNVKWIGLSAQDAADLASLLIGHAREAARGAGVALEIKL